MKRALLLILMLTPTAAWSQYTGSEMLSKCGAAVRLADGANLHGNEITEAMFCMGYVSGFLDAIPVLELTSKAQRNVCLPKKGITKDQTVRIFVKYLREHPEELHINARSQFYISILKAFPCK